MSISRAPTDREEALSTTADGYEDLCEAIVNGEPLHVAEGLRAHALLEPSEAAAAGAVRE